MNIRRALILATAIFLMGAFSGCHDWEPLPPGQVKQILDPPPGHGGTPPGQLKKY